MLQLWCGTPGHRGSQLTGTGYSQARRKSLLCLRGLRVTSAAVLQLWCETPGHHGSQLTGTGYSQARRKSLLCLRGLRVTSAAVLELWCETPGHRGSQLTGIGSSQMHHKRFAVSSWSPSNFCRSATALVWDSRAPS